jgi:hypothetical protein
LVVVVVVAVGVDQCHDDSVINCDSSILVTWFQKHARERALRA